MLDMKRDFTDDELISQIEAIYEHYAKWKKSRVDGSMTISRQSL